MTWVVIELSATLGSTSTTWRNSELFRQFSHDKGFNPTNQSIANVKDKDSFKMMTGLSPKTCDQGCATTRGRYSPTKGLQMHSTAALVSFSMHLW